MSGSEEIMRSSCRRPKKLWQGCGKNPDLAARTDIIDNLLFNGICNLSVCNASRLHPAYRLIRHFSDSGRTLCRTFPSNGSFQLHREGDC